MTAARLAEAAGTSVVVPAFAPRRGRGGASGRNPTPDPLAAALAEAVAVSAEVPHRGWRHPPPAPPRATTHSTAGATATSACW